MPRPDKLFTKGLFIKSNGGVSLWFIEIDILHRFLIIVFNLKLDVHVFHVLPSQFIMFSSFFLRGQKYGLTCIMIE